MGLRVVAVCWIWCYSRCRDEFESGYRLTICYKWSVIRPQISKPHKASAPSLFFLLFVEMLPPIPNLLTVSNKGLPMYITSHGLYNLKPATVFVPPCIKEDVEKLLDIHRTMGQVKLNVDLGALAVGCKNAAFEAAQ